MTGNSRSFWEEALAADLRAAGIPEPVREHRFLEGRRFRFDLAWPQEKLAVEVQGGTHSGGRHTRGAGYERDREKMNLAQLSGWRVLEVTPEQIRSGKAREWVALALGMEAGKPGRS